MFSGTHHGVKRNFADVLHASPPQQKPRAPYTCAIFAINSTTTVKSHGLTAPKLRNFIVCDWLDANHCRLHFHHSSHPFPAAGGLAKICSKTKSGVETVVPAKITSVSSSPPGAAAAAAAAHRKTPLTSASSIGVKPPTTKRTTTGLSDGLSILI